jgi:small subunit ribosomal protein S1
MENFKMDDLTMPTELHVGDVVKGIVVQVETNTIYLDVQSFTEGVMHLDHYTKDKSVTSFKGLVKVGDEIECEVAKTNENAIYLSRHNQLAHIAFKQIVDAKETNAEVTVRVTKLVPKKGYNVVLNGATLFMPLSQAPEEVKIGQELVVRVLEVNEERMTGVVSRRVIEREIYTNAKQAEMDSFNVGDVVKGTVAKIEKFGVFVKFEYNQGLIRINQLSHTFTSDINSVVKVGEPIEVKVLSKEEGKLLLSKKALLDTPFEAYVKEHNVGQTVKGKVTNKLPFGLLLELADNVKGLLHQSEYSHNPNDNFNDYVVIGDEVECAILSIDEKKEKVSLSRKALIDNPWTRVTAQQGDVVEVTVKELTDNGMLVETLGVDGFIPQNEILTPNQNGHFKDYYAVGDKANAEIIDIRVQEWRLRLSIKKPLIREERKSFEKYLDQEEEISLNLGEAFKDILK